MARREYDERDDYDDQPRKKSSNTGLIIGLVVGGGILLVVLGVGCLASVFLLGARPAAVAPNAAQGPTATDAGPTPKKTGKKTYTRAEFTKLVMGKTRDEVKAAVGMPLAPRRSAARAILAKPTAVSLTLQAPRSTLLGSPRPVET